MARTKEEITTVVTENVDLVQEYSTKLIEWAKVFVPNLIIAIITLLIGLWLIRKIAYLAVKGMERRNIEVSLRTFLKSLIGIGLKIILFITVAGMLGFQTTSFVAILGAAGLAVGLALQGSLGNFAGGVLILIFKPYKVGDTIEAMNQKGEVKEIQIFNTILNTPDHRTIILPNGAVSNGFIINHTKMGSARVDINVDIADTHPIEDIKELLHKTILTDERILEQPTPNIGFANYCAGGYTISIKLFTDFKNSGPLKGDIMELIKKTFDEKNIEGPRTMSFVKQVT
jgi:small conductance mechanosensitive channel